MYIRVPKDLVDLAEIFHKNKEKLYIVGGYVRNQLLGIPDKYNIDIDVCSSVLPEKVVSMLENTAFKTRYMNKELGVIEIKNNIKVEYATFRTEKYSMSGVHIPNNVEFIKDINKDSERRDFRCNAIYYDLIENEIVDPLNGYEDIKNKIIRTTINPKFVFDSDAERILRMVRFACTLGFNIDEKTYIEAKKNVYKLQYISATRKRSEFSKIVLADTKFDFLPLIKYAHARGLDLLADLGALKYLLPALEEIRKSSIIEDRGKPLFNHIMNVFAYSKPQVRLSALMHDVGKAKTVMNFGSFDGNQEFASIIIENNLGQEGLGYPKKIVERVKNVVFCNDFNKKGLESAKNIKYFIIENLENIELIIALKNAIAYDKSNKTKLSFSASRINKIYNKMIQDNVPLTISHLNIKGDEIIKNYPNIKVKKLGELLEVLLRKCVLKPYLNKKDNLLKLVEKIIKKNNSEFLE